MKERERSRKVDWAKRGPGGASAKYAKPIPPPPPPKPKKPVQHRTPTADDPKDEITFPPPGGVPEGMRARAESKKASPSSTFAALAEAARARVEAAEAEADDEGEDFEGDDDYERHDRFVQDSVAEMTVMNRAERRSSRAREETAPEELRLADEKLFAPDPFGEDPDAARAAIDPTSETAVEEKKRLPMSRGVTPYRQEQRADVGKLLGLPSVLCNKCPASENCPEFKANHDCAYTESFMVLNARDISNARPFLETVATLQSERAFRAVLYERLVAGGAIDANTTRQLEVASAARMALLELDRRIDLEERDMQVKEAMAQRTATLNVNATAALDGRQPPQGGGLLASLMASLAPPVVEAVAEPEKAAEKA